MAVPTNVTSLDHAREQAIVSRLVSEFGFSDPKLNQGDLLATFDGEIITPRGDKCLIELRSRNHSGDDINAWGGAFINCDKFWSAVKVARNSRKKYGFFLSCNGELWGRKLFDPDWSHEAFIDMVMEFGYAQPKRASIRAGQELNDSCYAFAIQIKRLG